MSSDNIVKLFLDGVCRLPLPEGNCSEISVLITKSFVLFVAVLFVTIREYCRNSIIIEGDNYLIQVEYGNILEEKGITKQFFNYKGRLNRLRYIKRKLVLFLFFYMPVGMINAILSQPTVYHELLTYLLWIVVIGGTVSELCLMARRIRDIQPAYVVGANYLRLRMLAIIFCMLFQIFFPPLGLICILINIYLLCAKGTNGTNIYGRDPLEV